MCFIVLPFTFVDVPIGVNATALAVCLVVRPVSLMYRSVVPVLDALTLTYVLGTLKPLSLVLRLSILFWLFQWSVLSRTQSCLKANIIVFELAELLSHLLHTHALIFLSVARHFQPRTIKIVSDLMSFALSYPHTEYSLQAHDDPDLLRGVHLTIMHLGRVKILLLSILLSAAVASHFYFFRTKSNNYKRLI